MIKIFDDLSERFPQSTEPKWYRDAVHHLRGRSDDGLFGRYIYELIRSTDEITTVLNIGTARGHSAVCAAKAFADADRCGEVHTIDIIPPREERSWHVNKHPSSDPLSDENVSMREIIQRFHNPDSEDVPINFHTGDSTEVLLQWQDDQPDLVFHDGMHKYKTVKEDIRLTTNLGPSTPIQIFDDCYFSTPTNSYYPLRYIPNRYKDVPKLGKLLYLLQKFKMLKQPFPGVTQAVREAYNEGPWSVMEIVPDKKHSPITMLSPVEIGY